jgi:hypothetical protein
MLMKDFGVMKEVSKKNNVLTMASLNALCTGEKDFGYQGIDLLYRCCFYYSSGDIIKEYKSNGTSGKSIYGEIFDGENIIYQHL